MKYPITLVLLLASAYSYSQTISGYIRDANTGENLIGATILDQTSGGGTTANSYGHFSLDVKPGPVEILCSYVGYEKENLYLVVRKDTIITIGLKSAQLQEVVINATRTENIQESSSMSRFNIPVEQIRAIPTLMGERDLMKVLQLLPGVQSGSEGSTGLYVRGGGPDQNLILLDGVPIYNASHLYGFFSTFNSDAINHVELVKGGFPARYGGRLSSVVDISMREGNQEKIKGRGTIGLISSKILVEGPIDKKSTFLFSARRSYLNLLKIGAIADDAQKVSDKYFLYDLNGKVNYRINKNNRIYLSGYNGGDRAGSSDKFGAESDGVTYLTDQKTKLGWGNTLVAFRWNHVYGSKLFSNVATTYSKYRFNTATDRHTSKVGIDIYPDDRYYKYDYVSSIQDIAARIDFDYTPGNKNYLRFGTGVTHHLFRPGILAIASKDSIQSGTYAATDLNANEGFIYAEDDIEITSRLKVNAGVHATAFVVENTTYHSVQPRISGRYLLTDKVSLKASYATMSQFVHLLTNAGVGLPTDLWVPSTSRIKPQNSTQYAFGAAGTWNDFEISIEGYYKDMRNVIEYKDGATYLSTNKNWQDKVEVGRGNSYGSELFIQKKIGKFNGWIGYTLSWTNRQFDNLNHGEWFPYRYDRRHDIKITGVYHLTKNLELGAVWVYSTGQAVTFPTVFYNTLDFFTKYTDGSGSGGEGINGGSVQFTPSRNNLRMTAYHRLDLSATYTIDKPKISHEFNLSVYNAYDRKNPYYLELAANQKQNIVHQVSLIAIVPSISYSINLK